MIDASPPVSEPKDRPEPIIRLEKTLIRPCHESDIEDWAREANNPKIAQWTSNAFPHPYTIDDASKWIHRAISTSPARHFAICHLDSNVVIGGIGLIPRDDIHYRTMQIGYWLGEQHWHQGIMADVVLAFTHWTFGKFEHVIRLEAEICDGNRASIRVVEKARYQFEARKHNAVEKWGVVMDELVYCRFREEY